MRRRLPATAGRVRHLPESLLDVSVDARALEFAICCTSSQRDVQGWRGRCSSWRSRAKCSRESPADRLRTAVPARAECRVLAMASRAAAGAAGARRRAADDTRTRARPWLRSRRPRRVPRAAGFLRRCGRLRPGRPRRREDARRAGRRQSRASRVRRRRVRVTVGLRRRARLGGACTICPEERSAPTGTDWTSGSHRGVTTCSSTSCTGRARSGYPRVPDT